MLKLLYAETLIEKVIAPNVIVFGYEFMEIVFFANNKVVVPIFSSFKCKQLILHAYSPIPNTY